MQDESIQQLLSPQYELNSINQLSPVRKLDDGEMHQYQHSDCSELS